MPVFQNYTCIVYVTEFDNLASKGDISRKIILPVDLHIFFLQCIKIKKCLLLEMYKQFCLFNI